MVEQRRFIGCGRRILLLASVALAELALSSAARQPAQAQSAGDAASGGSSSSSGAGDSGGLSIDTGGPPSPMAPIGTVLPPLGADPTSPGLRDNLLNAFGQNTQPGIGTNTGPAWQFMPQVTVSEEYVSNPGIVDGLASYPSLRNGAQQAGSDFVTLIQPQIAITDAGERLRVSLNYAPTGEIFAENSDFSQFRQQFSGDTLGVVMPDLVYADVRGSVYQQPIFGGLGPVSTVALPPTERETISSVSASPYITRSFGGTGTLQAGVGYVYTATDAPAFLNATQDVSVGLPDVYGSSWLADRRVFASFTTGQDYGRFQDSLSNDTNFYDGSGPLRNGQRVLVTNDLSYAVNRFAAALGEIGYENLYYPNEGFSYVGGVWSAGTRLTPNAVSTVTLEYRYIDGFYSPYVFGSWQITPRLRLFGGYSEGITSFDQDQQNNLLSGNPSATGAAASVLVAAPLLNNGAYFGSNQGLNHDRRLTATAAYLIDRDTITASFNWDRESLVGNPAEITSSQLAAVGITPFQVQLVLKYGLAPFQQYILPSQLPYFEQILNFNKEVTTTTSNMVAGLSWHHELRPTLTSDIYVDFSRSRQAETTLNTSDGVQFSAGLTKEFTKTVSGRISYAGTFFLSGDNGVYSQNEQSVIISLTKKF